MATPGGAGLNLFLSSYRFRKPLLDVAAASFPMLLALAFGCWSSPS